VLRGAGGKAFVAGTDISQFKVFESAEDGLAYERDGAARSARLERVAKPGDRADPGLRRRRRLQHHRVL
jgi:enoyl-CoA hydratase/carnithine racemase